MAGKLYGIGVGPGDPELLTLKAVRVIQECDILVVPGEKKEESVAYQIAEQAIPELSKREVIAVSMPMTKDKTKLDRSHKKAEETLEALLMQGKQVGFLTLGDPTIYSTYLYLHNRFLQKKYQTEIISGIPSFCAAAARLNIGLVKKAEPLHLIPASYSVEEALQLPGTKVLMKAGKKMGKVKATLAKAGCSVRMVENCGMENEKIYEALEEIPEDAGYYSLVIAKDSEIAEE